MITVSAYEQDDQGECIRAGAIGYDQDECIRAEDMTRINACEQGDRI